MMHLDAICMRSTSGRFALQIITTFAPTDKED